MAADPALNFDIIAAFGAGFSIGALTVAAALLLSLAASYTRRLTITTIVRRRDE